VTVLSLWRAILIRGTRQFTMGAAGGEEAALIIGWHGGPVEALAGSAVHRLWCACTLIMAIAWGDEVGVPSARECSCELANPALMPGEGQFVNFHR
jgi:hypothetical protein